MLSKPSEHSVWFGSTIVGQVINKDADVRFSSIYDKSMFSSGEQGCVNPSQNTLSRRVFGNLKTIDSVLAMYVYNSVNTCAAASSYPVVPLIWPAKKRPLILCVSREGFNWRGSM